MIDASMLKDFECREFFRQRYLVNRDLIAPNVHYQYGTAIHKAVQSFWEGKTYEQAIADAYEVTNAYPVSLIKHDVYLSNRWMEMVEQLPDLVAVYYDSVEQDVSKVQHDPWVYPPGPMIEREWKHKYSDDVILCGRIDRVMVGPELPDVKTASEISSQGVPWKKLYQRGKSLEIQFGLYDWYLQQIGMTPKRVYLEVLIKGYRGKKCRLDIIDLPYVVTDAYRERFRQQLAWKVREIVYYFQYCYDKKPWPMSQQLCQTKFSECPYIPLCYSGETPKNEELYTIREEHLEVRK
jgi:PD-(D/E)XK nuclease superfamily protein